MSSYGGDDCNGAVCEASGGDDDDDGGDVPSSAYDDDGVSLSL